MSKHRLFVDRKQNFWQLACIAGSALGFPGMIVGGRLAEQHGAGTALISVLTGNLLLWLIGIGLLSMAKSSNAIDNIRKYLGKRTGIVAAVVITMAFVIWYSVQIGGVAVMTTHFFQRDSLIEIGLIAGLFVSILGMRGMVWIRYICVYSIPVLIGLSLGVVGLTAHPVVWSGTWSFAMPGVFAVILIWLPGILNLPTLFRHAQNKIEAMLGLSLMILMHIFFQSITIFAGLSDLYLFSSANSALYNLFIVCFLMISYLCVNLVNLYFASSGLDVLFPRWRGMRHYFLVGIVGTALFACVQLVANRVEMVRIIHFLEIASGSFMGSLALVLSLKFLMRFFGKDHLSIQSAFWSNIIWIIGCVTTIYVQMQAPIGSERAFVVGVNMVIFACVLLGYFGVTFKAWKKLHVSD